MREISVGIDVSPLAQTRAGTARHVEGLVAGLEEEGGVDLRRYRFGGPGRATAAFRDVAWYLAVLPARAQRDGVDLLHCPTFRAPVCCSVPLVVTVHDLAVLRHPGTFNRWTGAYSAALLPRVVRAADAIVAVSEFTKSEVVELLAVQEEKIRVIPNGVDSRFAPDGRAASGAYVLAVSTLEPRKNLARLVEGFRLARLDGAELLVVGATGWGGVRIGGDGVRWLGEVADEELARLYRGALCVAYPSLYEGFGLPVLEAMACGAAVVTSQAAALSELADGAAVAVDALEPEAIAAGLEEAAGRRAELGRAGLERAARYSWQATARATLALYRSVVQ
jgi:glycosyltransferase involved in cell wall biosynthesis